VEEVKFGTPINQKFGKTVVERELRIVGGYKPGSELSRDLIAYSNVYWAKKIAGSISGGPIGNPVAVLTTERVNFTLCKSMGDLLRSGFVMNDQA